MVASCADTQPGAQFALALFWLNASVCRSLVIATTSAWLSFLLIFLLGGFILAKGAPWAARAGFRICGAALLVS